MRLSGLLFGTFLVACLNPAYCYAQSGEQHRSGEQSEAYHKHHDIRHGHDHVYPDRGAIVRDLPPGTIGINYADVSYRYHDGIWLESRGPAFMVVAPPIGVVVPTLPMFSTILAQGGETYLYANGAYYRPRPDLGGYEVVNEPGEESPQTGPETLAGGQLPGAAATASAVAASKLATPSATIGTGVSAAAPRSAATPSVSAQPATVPASAQTATAPVLAQPATVPASAQTVAVPASAQTATVPASAQTATVPAASAQTATVPAAPAQTATVPVLAQAASVPPPPAAETTSSTAAAPVPATLPAGPPSASPSAPPNGPKVFLYPKNGQTPDQQARDRDECYRYAVAQSGFDPTRSTGAASGAPGDGAQSDYRRAQNACFEALGYVSR
jgi:hypothetical protein